MKAIKLLGKALLGAALAIASYSSHASLIYLGPITQGGTGIGAVSTVLTLKDNSGKGCCTSSGAVSYNGSSDVRTGDAQGGALSKTWSITDLGWTDFASARIVFNADEPAGNGINLDNMVMTIYDTSGGALWNSGLFTPISFASTAHGIGNSGELFGLDAPQAAAAQAYFNGMNRIGLMAAVSDAQGGHDTFYLSLAAPCVGSDCPCFGANCPCVGANCPCVGANCPCVGPTCPCVGANCPCVGADCPCPDPNDPACGGGSNETPEPRSILLLSLGLLMLHLARRGMFQR
ncbi:hypothetical protein [Pseudoduganella violaceinigra]|uniref:hypothetical protein n=1 Tax=Pseudoduganella violaceinigra TaxID=246602 RepID=UPI0012B54AA4|nr:hypothetical protein [Pseudoduganella violaceinigra]